jgi:hypothetical protein
MLILSGALDSVLAEYGNANQIQQFERSEGPLREALFRRAIPFGRLRWLSMRRNHAAHWIQTANFVNRDQWSVKEDELRDRAVQQGLAPNRAALDDALEQLPQGDPWQLCQGKDLVGLLVEGLRKRLGKSDVGREEVTRLLRQSLQHPELQKLDLYRDILAWQTRNPPYRVLPR